MKLKGLTEEQITYRQEMENALREVAQDVIFNIGTEPFSLQAIRQEVFDNSEYDDSDDPPVCIQAKEVIKQLVEELLKYRDEHRYRMFIPLVRSGKFTNGMWQRLPYVTCMDISEYKGTIRLTIKVLGEEVKRLSVIEKRHKKLGHKDDQPITAAYNSLTT